MASSTRCAARAAPGAARPKAPARADQQRLCLRDQAGRRRATAVRPTGRRSSAGRGDPGPQEGAGRRAASPPRPSLGTLGSALHPGDKQMARVLDAIGARLDEASSSSPSASSVSGEYPA
jgi:hypothetical protein